MRFNSALFADNTPSQRQYSQPADNQAYPDSATAQANGQPDYLDQTATGSIGRQAVSDSIILEGPARQAGPAIPVPRASVGLANQAVSSPFPQQNAPAQPFPQQSASAQPFPGDLPQQQTARVARQALPSPTEVSGGIDRTVTGSIQRQSPQIAPSPIPAANSKEGWSRAGGTQIIVREGETVHNLSRRFGVPAKAIMQINGLNDATALRAGQSIIIPTYVYSQDLAPEDNPKVSDATPTRVPLPTKAPTQRVAVLPQPARPSERQLKPEGSDTARAATTGAVYTVISGDTLSGIARKTGSSTNAIKQANGLDSGLIRIGQKLVIPGANTGDKIALAQTPEGVDPITTGGVTSQPKAGYTAPKAEIEKMVERTATTPDATGVGRLRWPVHGRIVSDFGTQSGGKRNDGIDIAVPEGTPVKAAENGVVIYAGDGLKDFGNTVLVRHESGLVTVYGHNSDIIVSRGATVRRGQEIAKSGVSGNAGSPKLHFEVRKESTPVDPAKYLE